ncbi:gelsolin [Violaceomyces palustris]|uniref:Gelsolin n=1 Tax=Violaceomyces palustris TaxID=1673888 RepID=A0ACD0P714_9BASI|nr:gelsolin [Violaceomyces palustris]
MSTQGHERLSHLKQYKVEGSNVEFVGSKIDHQVKHKSSDTEPAWKRNGGVGGEQGLLVWRVEDFEVKEWPTSRYGTFYDGDSYIVLRTFKSSADSDRLSNEIFFWLGSETTMDEVGTAAYKTVELDEFLNGAAVQYREVQGSESPHFLSLFPKLTLLKGGFASGFRHVTPEETSVLRLLRISSPAGGGPRGIIVREVEPSWKELNENDCFLLDEGRRIRSWHGKNSSPMEKNKAAMVMAELVSEKEGKAETEVLAQTDSRSALFIQSLGGQPDSPISTSPSSSSSRIENASRPRRLFRLSDSTGKLMFDLVKNGENVGLSDFHSEDCFVYDSGTQVFVWQGSGSSRNERSMWLKVAQAYLGTLESGWATPIAKIIQGYETPAFKASLDVAVV